MKAPNAAPRLSLVDAAYEQIRRRILDNVWPPGHRALEQEVALALGMSRTPVREALMRLQNEGLVEVIPRHGMRVLPVSPTDMREIYQILTALECMAAELLARRKPGEGELEPLVDATEGHGPGPSGRGPGRLGRRRRTLPRPPGRAGRQPPAAGHGAELLGPRAPRAHVHAAPAAQAGQLHRRSTCRWSSGCCAGDAAGAAAVNRAHRERASRELVAIFERYKLAQM